MLSEPVIQHRKEQPYAAIRTKIAMKDIAAILPPLIPEVSNWLAKNKIEPAGPPFFQYLSMDKNNQLLTDVGFPVAKAIKGNGRIIGDSFPAGTYVSITHTGDYIHLKEAHIALHEWAAKNGFKAKRHIAENGEEWGSATEIYLTDPNVEPSPDKWKTDIVFLLEDK